MNWFKKQMLNKSWKEHLFMLPCRFTWDKEKKGISTKITHYYQYIIGACYIGTYIFQHSADRENISMWCATSDALSVRSKRTPHLRNLSPLLKLRETHTNTHIHIQTSTENLWHMHSKSQRQHAQQLLFSCRLSAVSARKGQQSDS